MTTDITPTLQAANGESGNNRVTVCIQQNGKSSDDISDKAFTLTQEKTSKQQVICYAVDCRNAKVNDNINGTLQAKGNRGVEYEQQQHRVATYSTEMLRNM